MAAVSQTTFSNAFSWMKMYVFLLKFHWSLFLRGPINNISALVQVVAWRRSGDKPLSEPMMVGLPTHICVTRPQWVKMLALSSQRQQSMFTYINAVFIICLITFYFTVKIGKNQSRLARMYSFSSLLSCQSFPRPRQCKPYWQIWQLPSPGCADHCLLWHWSRASQHVHSRMPWSLLYILIFHNMFAFIVVIYDRFSSAAASVWLPCKFSDN